MDVVVVRHVFHCFAALVVGWSIGKFTFCIGWLCLPHGRDAVDEAWSLGRRSSEDYCSCRRERHGPRFRPPLVSERCRPIAHAWNTRGPSGPPKVARHGCQRRPRCCFRAPGDLRHHGGVLLCPPRGRARPAPDGAQVLRGQVRRGATFRKCYVGVSAPSARRARCI